MTIAHITLATRDVERTSQFFETTFGWRPIHRPGNIKAAAGWLEITPGQQLHLLHVEDFEPSPFEAEFGRHVALFHDHADFDALKTRLAAAGAQLIEPGRETPFARFFFREPNGYMFEVIDQDDYVSE
jgi:catechol 2,3-dioxygenase-like lactoylglutathione lyase family enzyme